MLEHIEKCEKERLTIYLPAELVKRIKVAALEQGKTLSKYIADIVEEHQ